jgi:excisionase family DNA binding protein
MNNKQTEPIRLVNIKFASRYLGLCERSVWSLAKEGKIPVVHIGRSVRFDIEDLSTFIEKAKRRAGV